MNKMYCEECGSYLMASDGECHDCHCGWKQPCESEHDSDDNVTNLRDEISNLNDEISDLKESLRYVIEQSGKWQSFATDRAPEDIIDTEEMKLARERAK